MNTIFLILVSIYLGILTAGCFYIFCFMLIFLACKVRKYVTGKDDWKYHFWASQNEKLTLVNEVISNIDKFKKVYDRNEKLANDFNNLKFNQKQVDYVFKTFLHNSKNCELLLNKIILEYNNYILSIEMLKDENIFYIFKKDNNDNVKICKSDDPYLYDMIKDIV